MTQETKTIKVLVADDEQDIVNIMANKLTAAGYSVVKAFDGREAWTKIQSEKPDVIVLDLMMPGMDGFAVLKNVREAKAAKWQPVIIVSAKSELDDMKQGYAMEADHYITKPCTAEDVLKAIKLMVSLAPQRTKE